jgi:uracil phosphoribosyltransferase
MHIILMNASKATGGSAMKAVEVLQEQGVPEERIIFINLVCFTASII